MSKKKDNLEEFFEEVNDKNKELNNKQESNKKVKKRNEDKPKESKIKTVLIAIALILGIAYILLQIKDSFNSINYIKNILNYSLLLIILIFISISIIGNKKIRNILSSLSAILLIALISINILETKDVIKFPTLAVMKNLNNTTLVDAMKWASKNKIDLNTTYEFSDNYDEGILYLKILYPILYLKKSKKLI